MRNANIPYSSRYYINYQNLWFREQRLTPAGSRLGGSGLAAVRDPFRK